MRTSPIAAVMALLLSACSGGSGVAERIPLGKPLVQVQPDQVTELAISKNDARTQDVWTARLTRPGSGPDWEIASAPGGAQLLDRRADSSFVNHLLSLLKTLQAETDADKGPHSSFGLDSPLFAIRFGDPARGRMSELRIGQSNPKGPGNFAVVAFEKGFSQVVIARGSALHMLSLIQNFETLRRKRIVTFEADDVDELELWSGRSRQLYAQRAGDDWTDARNRRLPAEVGAKLEALTHLRAQSFQDDAARAAPLRELLEQAPAYRAVFKDRKGNPTELRIALADGRAWARISSRPDGVFELPVDSLRPWIQSRAKEPAKRAPRKR